MTGEIAAQNESTRPDYTPPETPRIFPRLDGFELRWSYSDLDISCYVTRITDKGTAEVTFFYANLEQIANKTERILLAPNIVNFMVPNQKYNLAKQLGDIGHTDEFIGFLDWERKVNQIALAVMKECRKNIPASYVGMEEGVTLAADYLVEPILYRDLPNVIFGDYASLKSITAMVLAYIAQLPFTENKLGLTPDKEKPSPCLWLDYEGQSTSFKKQWTAIQKGFVPDYEVPILYKEMTVPLADAITEVRREMLENQIRHIVVDSLGPAAGGNLNDPEPAIRYHGALRTLGGTSTTLAHNSKDPNSGSKSIFGSVFFSNLARSIFQCKADKVPGSKTTLVSLKQIKASLSLPHESIGFIYTFDEQANTITVCNTDLKGTPLAGDLTISLRIKDALRAGSMTVKELAEAIEEHEPSVRTALSRLKKGEHPSVVQLGDKWGLLA